MRCMDRHDWPARIFSPLALVALLVTQAQAATAPPATSTPQAAQAPANPPAAAKRPVEDIYFDTTMNDDYQWLENWESPETHS